MTHHRGRSAVMAETKNKGPFTEYSKSRRIEGDNRALETSHHFIILSSQLLTSLHPCRMPLKNQRSDSPSLVEH
ncbi:hypothetical protein N7541_004853 [Penicillium brevicompactum]|uniref:Uncharacterized protein n=1 Tax=Penicillium brevicompactum TaxID=5074 RepID=A0A9W9RCG4_PENBR|nr:uncharacterized protein N7506_004707 [Penicillium brevicompactum]KAJ5336685.1 hypothetical protein N7506_004707 [Penicillium brevicompactum]KAJ5357695.1 hypothetical protein N7541_004853 [Penicillium brevicompactum]